MVFTDGSPVAARASSMEPRKARSAAIYKRLMLYTIDGTAILAGGNFSFASFFFFRAASCRMLATPRMRPANAFTK